MFSLESSEETSTADFPSIMCPFYFSLLYQLIAAGDDYRDLQLGKVRTISDCRVFRPNGLIYSTALDLRLQGTM